MEMWYEFESRELHDGFRDSIENAFFESTLPEEIRRETMDKSLEVVAWMPFPEPYNEKKGK